MTGLDVASVESSTPLTVVRLRRLVVGLREACEGAEIWKGGVCRGLTEGWTHGIGDGPSA